jgi:putative membrane-bound dehydrogenase-like protein
VNPTKGTSKWLVQLLLCGVAQTAFAAPTADPAGAIAEEGFISLFNGKDLTGWSADPAFWRVDEGAIVGTTTAEKIPTKGNTFAVWEGSDAVPRSLANFELRLRYRFDVDANNSGIQIRSRLLPNVTPWTIAGYQYDLGWNQRLTASMYGERGRGALAAVGQKIVIDAAGRRWQMTSIPEAKEIAAHVRVRDWNDVFIRAVGNRIEFFHNGRKSLELVDHEDRGDDVKGRTLDGLLALQLHVGPPMQVRFADIRVKLLPAGGMVPMTDDPIGPGAKEILPPLQKPPAAPAKTAAEEAAEKAAAAERRAKLQSEIVAPKEFTATVFATPEQANYPVFVAATHDGTLFVSSDRNGSAGRDPHRGRILRLRDTDGDGAADDVKEFATDIDSPRGLVWVDDQLLVLHPPHVSSLRDRNNDGIADERTLLVRGIAFDYSKRPADHTSNGLTIGVDGWIYAAIGDFGFMDAEGTDGRHLQLRGGGVVRFRPDGSGLDLFARGTRNIFEVAVGPLLDMIARDNSNDGGGWNVRLHAFTGLEDHGYPRRYMHFADEIVAPLADYGGGSGTGACWIDEPWMPQRWNNGPFTCDWGRGAIYRHPLTAKGAGYEAGQEEFLKIPRATDLDADSQGAIYAASWRNGTYGWSGPDVGFIARLVPNSEGGSAAAAVPQPAFATAPPAELVAVLAGPSHRLRLEAQRALVRRKLVSKAATELERLAADGNASLASRVATVFTLSLGRGAAAVPTLTSLAGDPTIAAWAVRGLGDLAAAGTAVPRETLLKLLASADPRVRKEAIVAVVRTAAAADSAAILQLTADPDPVVAHTAIEGILRLAAVDERPVIEGCATAVDESATPAAVRAAAGRILGEIHSEPAVKAVLSRLATTREPQSRQALAWAAARQWRREATWKWENWGTRPDTRGPYYAAEEWQASPQVRAALVDLVARAPSGELSQLARTLGLHRLPASEIVPAILARGDAAFALVTFLDFNGDPPPPAALPVLEEAAREDSNPPAERLAAIRVLSRSPQSQVVKTLFDVVVAMEAAVAPADVVAEARRAVRESAAVTADIDAVAALAADSAAHAALVDDAVLTLAGSSTAKSAARGVAAAWIALEWNGGAAGGKGVAARRLAIVAASERTGSSVLATQLVAAADQTVDPTLATAAASAIKRLKIDAGRVRQVASDTGPTVGKRPAGDVLSLIETHVGDLAVGAELFVRQKCVSCHAAGVDSAGLGPSIANAAGIYNRRQLAESVLLPDKRIAQGFATTVLVCDDGRQLVGFVTSEGADVVTLRDAQGAEHRIEKTAIEERAKLPTSVMPAGLVADLTVAQFASLIDYLESLGK